MIKENEYGAGGFNGQFKSRVKKILHVSRTAPPSVVLEVLLDKMARRVRLKAQKLRVKASAGKGFPKRSMEGTDTLRKDAKFFFFDTMGGSKEHFLSTLYEVFPQSFSETLAAADRIMRYEFDLLGSGQVCLGERIDWQRDFKSGKKWESAYFEEIREVEIKDDSDIKIPWELSRCYHFIILGKAFFFSGDERYAKEFISQFEDWIEKNEVYFGVNWHCAMEVAFRAINWIWAYYLFSSSKLFTSEKRSVFIQSLAAHGKYIYDNLEFDRRLLDGEYLRVNGNHYLSDLVGLVYLGILLPGSEAKKWLTKGVEELILEIDVQVLSDGVHWEMAPSYHRLVSEMLISAAILCRQNGINLPSKTLDRIRRMFLYIMHYTRPDGLCPLVRDADDGRLHLLGGNEFRDHRHLLSAAAIFFDDQSLLSNGAAYSEDALWLLGLDGYTKFVGLDKKEIPLKSQAFGESQYFVLRKVNSVHLFASCADIGMKGLYGGHAHNDCLSFEFFASGAMFITDSWSSGYSADPEGRNKFRSTEFHNTMRVDKMEINQFSPAVLFGMTNDARPRVNQWLTTYDFAFLDAEHYGYTRLPQGVVHRRLFYFDKALDQVIIEDQVLGDGEHLFEFFFHFHPEVVCDRPNNRIARLTNWGSSVYLVFLMEDGWKLSIDDTWNSERYGKKRPSKKLVLSKRCSAPTSIKTAIVCGADKRGH